MTKGLLIDFGSSKTKEIYKCLKTCLVDFEEKSWAKTSERDISMASWIVMSGSPTLLTEVDSSPHQKIAAWAFNTEIPILAICFSHQLMGLHHGVSALMMNVESREPLEINLVNRNGLFSRLTNPVFDQDHCEEIDLPKGFEHLASSSICRVEAMKHPDKLHFGVQFHPETSGKNGLKLFQNFFNQIRA